MPNGTVPYGPNRTVPNGPFFAILQLNLDALQVFVKR